MQRLLGFHQAGSCCAMAAGRVEAAEMTVKAAESGVVDVSEMGLQHFDTDSLCSANTFTLILDKNQLTKLENVEKCSNLVQLSAANNRLVRMIGVAKLVNLRVLNLPNNSIGNIEGLKDLIHLEWLNLAGNNIKTVEAVNGCLSLRHLDLSDNNIALIGDLSKLLSLKILLLHGNTITTLRSASGHLPPELNILSLAENEIRDLNEVSYLGFLRELEQLSIMNNPCVMATPSLPGFDYRPYIVSWCLTLRILDGYVISQKESLKAEWLYSQGKGRSFRPAQHVQLVQYLASVCPLTSTPALQSAEDAKLEKILNKQRLHQLELMEKFQKTSHIRHSSPNLELSFQNEYNSKHEGHAIQNAKEPVLRINSWVAVSGHGQQSKAVNQLSPIRREVSGCCHGELFLEDIQTDEDKLNSSLLSSESTFMPVTTATSPLSPSRDLRLPADSLTAEGDACTLLHLETGVKCEDSDDQKYLKATREAEDYEAWVERSCERSKEESVSKVLPASFPVQTCVTFTSSKSTNSMSAQLTKEHCFPDDNLLSQAQIETVQEDMEDDSMPDRPDICKPFEESPEYMNKAAVKIQACWRGFYTRNWNPKAKEIRCEIRLRRMQEHVEYLNKEVIRWRKQCEEERIQRMVQEEAVKFLWKAVQHLQEWQLSMTHKENELLLVNATKEPILLQPNLIHPSAHTSLNNHKSLPSRPNAHSEVSLQAFPDSGFHSSDITHNCLQDSQNFCKSSSDESMSTVLEATCELKKIDTECFKNDPAEQEIQESVHTKWNKENSNGEQDSSLIQQYLNSVRQLEAAEDESNFSGRTECNSQNDVHDSLCGSPMEMPEDDCSEIPDSLCQAEECVSDGQDKDIE
ncbi:centrosomal protein of 97 kDa isoform X1 [Leucoraja erinacea]|uniref:centrosomal protein of 97 kDa isoform X1 n=2 Tax=Leucoraja erinaceus TaxID=7782 RepID=UPI002455FD59|nr:centrosomal protein of 97 kDa isoform X1 [Leucoraja erinacea]